MPDVLPPRPAGTLAALAACPDADVIFVAHTGLDRLVSVRDVWRSLLTDMEVRPGGGRSRRPTSREARREAQVAWLYDWWDRIEPPWIDGEPAMAAVIPARAGRATSEPSAGGSGIFRACPGMPRGQRGHIYCSPHVPWLGP